jgi:hypothetical protein
MCGNTDLRLKMAQKHSKNPAAVSLGRRGGKKGGPARAKVLSAARRKAIASMGGKAKYKTI